MVRHITPTRGLLGGMTLALLTLAAGCGGPPGGSNVVSGKVSYRGRPLTTGTIELHGPEGKIRASSIGADGSFSVVDAPVGEDTVVVKVPAPVRTPPGVQMAKSDVAAVPIPPQYAYPASSGVKETIAAGRSTVSIDLK